MSIKKKILPTVMAIMCFTGGLNAKTLVTKSGKKYPDYKVMRVTGNGLVISYKGGGCLVPTADLPKSLLQKYADDIEFEKENEEIEDKNKRIKSEKERIKKEKKERGSKQPRPKDAALQEAPHRGA